MAWWDTGCARSCASARDPRCSTSKRVRTSAFREEPYDGLVLATGSAPFVPPVFAHGASGEVERPGVFVYRTIEDLEAIRAGPRRAG